MQGEWNPLIWLRDTSPLYYLFTHSRAYTKMICTAEPWQNNMGFSHVLTAFKGQCPGKAKSCSTITIAPSDNNSWRSTKPTKSCWMGYGVCSHPSQQPKIQGMVSAGEKFTTYLIAGVNIHTIPQVIQCFVQIPRSCSPKKAGCCISLGGKRKETVNKSTLPHWANLGLVSTEVADLYLCLATLDGAYMSSLPH